MIVIQLQNTLSNPPCDIIKELSFNTYVLDCSLRNYDIISDIVNNNRVVSMCPDAIDAITVNEAFSDTYTTIQFKPCLDEVLEAIDELLTAEPTVVCFSWQIPRNFILEQRIEYLIENGHTVVCSGGNTKLPLLDLSPVATDGVIRVGADEHTGKASWIDSYDYIIPGVEDSNIAAHKISEKLFNKEDINLDLELNFYSDSTVRSAPWARRLVSDKTPSIKHYEFFPVSNLRYVAGEQLAAVKPGDTVSYLYGNCPLYEFVTPDNIECGKELPRGITFDITNGWLFGTFKYRQDMFHRLLVDVNGQLFEFHIISCDAENKPSYETCKEKYYNREYDAPPFSIREYWMPMSKPIKILEPGDPWIRTYNLNDLHLYRKSL